MKPTGRVLAGLVLLAVTGCGGKPANEVTLKGSDSMVILAQKWAEAFMAANPGKVVKVAGGGSAVGIAALIGGGADFALTTRSLTQDEAAQVLARRKAEAKETAVALDAIVVWVSAKNGVSSLSVDGLAKIYTGSITDWKKAGGRKGAIALLGAENGSDLAVAFKERALKGADALATVKAMPGSAAVLEAVVADPLAIGYGNLAAVPKGAKALKLKVKGSTVGAAAPALQSGKYPLTEKLLVCMAGEPAQGTLAADFLAFVLSADGQKICADAGYVSLKPAKAAKKAAKKTAAKKPAAKKK
ncbi:MAG: phosphate ABC transporter substrate-binding protein [Candidatus Coatesbacteria bacterium]